MTSLVEVDRASMSVALETRAPFLDHRVVEFVWSLPVAFKVRGQVRKWLLRQMLSRFVPPGLVNPRKMGFSIPLAAWLRGELREWAEAHLSTSALQDSSLNAPVIRRIWAQHCAGHSDNSYVLWNILSFQAWRSSVGA